MIGHLCLKPQRHGALGFARIAVRLRTAKLPLLFLLCLCSQARGEIIYEPIHMPADTPNVFVTSVVRGPNRPTLVFIDRTPDIRARNDTGFDITGITWQIPSEKELTDFLAEIDPRKRKFDKGGSEQPQIITNQQAANYNTGNQFVKLGDVNGNGKIGTSDFFGKRKPEGKDPTDKFEFLDGKIAKDRVFTDEKTVMKDTADGKELAKFRGHWAAVSYSVPPARATGQTGGGKSHQSLTFDATTGILSLTDFPLSSAYITSDIDVLDTDRVDSQFMGDPFLDATLSFTPFKFAYDYLEDGVQKAFFEGQGGELRITNGLDVLLTASTRAGMIFDPYLNVPFFAPLTITSLNTSLESAFIAQLQSRLNDQTELPFDLFISPFVDFAQATENFNVSATVAADAGIAQEAIPVPEPSTSLILVHIGLCIFGSWGRVHRWPGVCRRNDGLRDSPAI